MVKGSGVFLLGCVVLLCTCCTNLLSGWNGGRVARRRVDLQQILLMARWIGRTSACVSSTSVAAVRMAPVMRIDAFL